MKKKRASVIQQVDKVLTSQAWYHGLMPRKEVEDMLKVPGDYLVRKTTVARQVAYCISVRHTTDVKHIPVVYKDGSWTLKDVRLTFFESMHCIPERGAWNFATLFSGSLLLRITSLRYTYRLNVYLQKI